MSLYHENPPSLTLRLGLKRDGDKLTMVLPLNAHTKNRDATELYVIRATASRSIDKPMKLVADTFQALNASTRLCMLRQQPFKLERGDKLIKAELELFTGEPTSDVVAVLTASADAYACGKLIATVRGGLDGYRSIQLRLELGGQPVYEATGSETGSFDQSLTTAFNLLSARFSSTTFSW
ncbi:MAG TPA: hypothetical protein VNG90_00095 [Candidatus Acidoferrum sp.]|nr:hypothetical protein [Candidatus Acidoferrum sp.]